MDIRKENLLLSIIQEYIKTHEPVGSNRIAHSSRWDVSPATIRNEMSDLEKLGYITHPHTSAGRIPTEKGYEYYVKNFVSAKEPSKREKDELKKASQAGKNPIPKKLLKALAEITLKTVFVAQGKENLYITGISYLFSQPEFEDYGLVCDMTEIFDEMENVVSNLYHEVDDIEIFVGKNNPFGKNCSAVVAVFRTDDSSRALLGAIGPLRMDYEKTFSIIHYVRELILS